jgi:hypothetical protein
LDFFAGRPRLQAGHREEDIYSMQWNRSMTIGLAKTTCALCHGYGLRLIRGGKEVPCSCVFRAIFRACYYRFRECVAKEKHMSTVTLEFCPGREGRRSYSRKTEEYIADFCLVSRRTLDESQYRIFRFHFLLGADWKLCCRQMKIDRGNFFHEVYRIQQKLGRTFAELEPYALFPLDEYFSPYVRKDALSAGSSSLRRDWEVALPRSA